MRTQPFDFLNAAGRTLSARLDLPDGQPHAFALFAHCFTCSKTSRAAVRVSRALAGLGIGVLRFDFTGLGEGEGEVGIAPFSADVEDVVAAAAHMQNHGCAPQLLLGHSLGGAAVLAAAGRIPGARAVAVIAAPYHPQHVLELFRGDLDRIEAEGVAEVTIGDRPFTVSRAFVEDVRRHDPHQRIAELGRALLILHSPRDKVVGIDNATAIFQAAKHPKSFVSLDRADHLLTDPDDAEYAAGVIAAWASRYVGGAADVPIVEPGVPVTVEETGTGKYQVQVVAGGARFFADEPVAVGGLGTGPSPYELVAAGLGACTAMTLRMYAELKGLPLKRVRVSLRHEKREETTPNDLFVREIGVEGDLEPAQIARLYEIADRCPVHRTLEGGAEIETRPLPPVTPEAARAEEEEHFHDMEKACAE